MFIGYVSYELVNFIGARLSDSEVLNYLFPRTNMIKIINLKSISVYCIKIFTENPPVSIMFKKCTQSET